MRTVKGAEQAGNILYNLKLLFPSKSEAMKFCCILFTNNFNLLCLKYRTFGVFCKLQLN